MKRRLWALISASILSLAAGCKNVLPPGLPINSVALILSPNSDPPEMLIFELLNHRVADSLPVGSLPSDLAVSRDGRRVIVTSRNDGSITSFERQSGFTFLQRGTISVGNFPLGVAFNQQGTEAYVSVTGNASIVILNTSNFNIQPSIIGAVRILPGANTRRTPEPAALVSTPDNQRLFVVDQANNTLLSFNRQQSSFAQGEIWQAPPTAPVELRGLTIDRRGRLFLVNAANDEIIVFNATNIQTEVAHISLRDTQFSQIDPTNLELTNNENKLYVTETGANAVGMIPLQNLQGNVSLAQIGGRNIPLNTGGSQSAFRPIGVDTTANDQFVYVTNAGSGRNISIINGQLDQLDRNIGTSSSLATSLPLGKMKIVSFGAVSQPAAASTQSVPNQTPLPGFAFFPLP